MSDLAVEARKVHNILGVDHLPHSIQRGIFRTVNKTNDIALKEDIITPLEKEHFDSLINLSMALKLKDVGPVCGLLISASTVQEWLHILDEYSELLGFSGSFIQIDEKDNHTLCRLKLNDENTDKISRYTIFELGLFFRLCKYSFAERIKSIRVIFPDVVKHCHIQSLSAGFELTSEDNHSHDVILTIPSKTLKFQLPDSNQKVARIFRKNIERSHKTTDNGLTYATLEAIRSATSFGDASQKNIAKTLCVSERTLVRRLHADGVTFRELFNEVRNVKALELLFEGQSVESISTYLGFSERATFERAFKKWQRVTPVAMQSRFARLNNESAIDNQICLSKFLFSCFFI